MTFSSIMYALEVCRDIKVKGREIYMETEFIELDSDASVQGTFYSEILSFTEYFDKVMVEVTHKHSMKIHLAPEGEILLCGAEVNHGSNYCMYRELFDLAYREESSKYFCKRCIKSWDKMGRSMNSVRGGMLTLRSM